MADVNEKENLKPGAKKRRLSLTLKKDRFKSVSSAELNELSRVTMPKNTTTSSCWAMKNFRDWFKAYNARNPGNECPNDVLLPSCSTEILNKWLSVYIAETRSSTGESYPPATLYQLLTGILRHMRSENPSYPNFLAKKSPEFSTFTTTLDNLFKGLRSAGVGATSKHTEANI